MACNHQWEYNLPKHQVECHWCGKAHTMEELNDLLTKREQTIFASSDYITNTNMWAKDKVLDVTTKSQVGEMRQFDTGATRNIDTNKHDPEGFLNPLVIEAFDEYMHKHRFQADGKMRDADNWQKGIPKDAYMKSMWRHFLDLWKYHRGYKTKEQIMETLPALMFNVMGYFLEVITEREALKQK